MLPPVLSERIDDPNLVYDESTSASSRLTVTRHGTSRGRDGVHTALRLCTGSRHSDGHVARQGWQSRGVTRTYTPSDRRANVAWPHLLHQAGGAEAADPSRRCERGESVRDCLRAA